MKRITYISMVFILMAAACGRPGKGMRYDGDSTTVVRQLYDTALRLEEAHDADSALAVMLVAADYAKGCQERETCYLLYQALAKAYEKKNLFDLQEKILLRQLEAAQAMNDKGKTATTLFTLGVARYAQGDDEQALIYMGKAYKETPTDSARLRAKCQLMCCQVFLQTETTDSAVAALQQAKADFPPITKEDIYHLSEVYALNSTGQTGEVESKISQYLETDSIYPQIEMLGLLMAIHERQGKTQAALDDAKQLLTLNDSVAQREASQSSAKIHQLQHEEQMKLAAANELMLKEKSRSRMWALLSLFILVVAIAVIAIVVLRRRAVAARQAELEALRLAEDAQSSEAEVRALNEDLQRRYYEHLYAILLPILNAQRTKSGHIDLNEKSWRLIEENTDLVLPSFTRQLRKNHPSLSDEDVRFCCLVAMKVPNPVIANIYGIASSSVAVRKQRMKRKLDELVVNETLETYLSNYGL
ncbi:MAG: hypothetical protein IJM04_09330 [Prevotella sp.]|nr:hypothetical protein [Prevotella sp.]